MDTLLYIIYTLATVAISAILLGLTFVVYYYTLFIILKIRGDIKLSNSKTTVLRYKQKAITHRLRGDIQEEIIDYRARKANEQHYIDSFDIPVE